MSQSNEKDIEYLIHNIISLQDCQTNIERIIQSGAINPKTNWIKKTARKIGIKLIRPYIDEQNIYNLLTKAALSDIYRILSSSNQPESEPSIDPLAKVNSPRVIQLVSTLNFGDAVGNEVVAFNDILQKNGYKAGIYANNIDNKVQHGTARYYRDMPQLKENDLIIYHFASECDISKDLKTFPCKIILRYHNVTPPEFFHGFDSEAEKRTKIGLSQVQAIAPYIDYVITPSQFNKECLLEMGYTCPIEVLPILLKLEDYDQEPDAETIKKYSDGKTNLLFVGRMAPNKKIEDVISVFAEYKKTYNSTARLFLVGSYGAEEKYYQFLKKHIQRLGIEDVYFSGKISFATILAYYSTANVFLCMSEHEGFCVPIIEAMHFSVPILAYNSSAVPSTLGNGGLIVDIKDPKIVASELNELINCDVTKMIDCQKEQMRQFASSKIGALLLDFVDKNSVKE